MTKISMSELKADREAGTGLLDLSKSAGWAAKGAANSRRYKRLSDLEAAHIILVGALREITRAGSILGSDFIARKALDQTHAE